MIDTAQYQRMLAALEDSFSIIISGFFDETERFTTDLTSLMERNDTEGFQRLCHEIRGAASSIGFAGITNYAAAWEDKARSGALPPEGELPGAFSRLVEETKIQANLLSEQAISSKEH